ncbi:TlyA family RNA methyltransferase [Ruminococcus flavefaciens]|uniref:TlyA family RNA methyltransferase n=1 Tax=Ruminococcus flavefaciens TaxID=1265 RepID=UPI00048D5B80|nr:TlyA family RNA methyltransferase [Ruminococcus flavefaciens]
MARLDSELVSRGLARSRERAKEMIRSGSVTVNDKAAKKPSDEVSPEDRIETSETDTYVGRGALKLEKAYEEFGLDLKGKICLDIGASTGGFTDFMLRQGAEKVFAVDVGHGQLAQSLAEDSRVVNMEGTDIREVTADDIGGQADFISVDVSFISLTKILPKVYELLKEGAVAAVLIKPQFEAGRSDIGKRGIVKDRKVHIRVLSEIDSFASSIGFITEKYTFSPVRGGSGNIEYLVKLRRSAGEPVIHDFRELTDSSFSKL